MLDDPISNIVVEIAKTSKKKKNNKCDDFFLLVPKGYKFINFSFGHKIKNRFICYKKSKLN